MILTPQRHRCSYSPPDSPSRSSAPAHGSHYPGSPSWSRRVAAELIELPYWWNLSKPRAMAEPGSRLPSRLVQHPGCATRRCVFVWRWKGSTAGPSQRSGEAGGSLIRGSPGRAGSSLDNVGTGRYCQTARVRLARSEGVTRVNQRLKPRNGASGSNLADMGRDAVRDPIPGCGSTPEPVLADGEEATLKACGVGVAMLPGYSWTPTWPNDAQ
jgi:hypothetical protein